MRVQAHVDPGILIYDSLEPHQASLAFSLLKSLMVHKKMIEEFNAEIPVTSDYLNRIFSSLDNIKIMNPPLEKQLRSYIVGLLGHSISNPPLIPTKIDFVSLLPEVSSDWIDIDTQKLWLDCVASSIYEGITKSDGLGVVSNLTLATWEREKFSFEVVCTCPELCRCLDINLETKWPIPVLVNQMDWDEFQIRLLPWPERLTTRVEIYARKILRVPIEKINNRLNIEFTDPCYREICRENNPVIIDSIIDVVACRAYNCLRPEHGDETVKSKKGLRRIYVKKMAPSIRLHYYLIDNVVQFTMYSNIHNKGL